MKTNLKKLFRLKTENLNTLIDNLITQIDYFEPLYARDLKMIFDTEQRRIDKKNELMSWFVIPFLILISILATTYIFFPNTKYPLFIFLNIGILTLFFSPLIFFNDFNALTQYQKLIDILKNDKDFVQEKKKEAHIRNLAQKISEKITKIETINQKPFDMTTLAVCVYFLRDAKKFPMASTNSTGEFLYQFAGVNQDIRFCLDNPFKDYRPDTNLKRLDDVKKSFHNIGFHDSDEPIDILYQKFTLESNKLREKKEEINKPKKKVIIADSTFASDRL